MNIAIRNFKTKHTFKSISIITVTQYSRFNCLLLLQEMIQNQDYPFIKEWIIVEGSKSKEEASINQQNIENQLQLSNIIKYVEYDANRKLSDHRNIGNDNTTSDIIVCMDDDDYYQPDYVSHVVKKLASSEKQIAGCSGAFMYQFDLCQLYKFKSFGPNHTTNNCMAYTADYLKTHRYAPGLSFAEEKSFTNDFEEKMAQLNPLKCIVISSHDSNTVDKKHFCLSKNNCIRESNLNIKGLISGDIFDKMVQVFNSCE